MTEQSDTDPFRWVLAKKQLSTAIDSLSPAEFREWLCSFDPASRAGILDLIGQAPSALGVELTNCRRAAPAKRGARRSPDVEIPDTAQRLRARSSPDKGATETGGDTRA